MWCWKAVAKPVRDRLSRLVDIQLGLVSLLLVAHSNKTLVSHVLIAEGFVSSRVIALQGHIPQKCLFQLMLSFVNQPGPVHKVKP